MLVRIEDGTPLDDEEFERWRTEADRALAAARLQRDGGLHNWACFTAEQGAQLAVKALLHGMGRGPWGHDLARLGDRVREAGLELPVEIAEAMHRLGRHYIAARYPDAHASGPPGAHYTESDAVAAIGDAEAIAHFIDGSWRAIRG